MLSGQCADRVYQHHGDALGDHGMAFKVFFYDSMARVPLMVRDERYKYAYYASGVAGLYDMQEDRDEVENLAGLLKRSNT